MSSARALRALVTLLISLILTAMAVCAAAQEEQSAQQDEATDVAVAAISEDSDVVPEDTATEDLKAEDKKTAPSDAKGRAARPHKPAPNAAEGVAESDLLDQELKDGLLLAQADIEKQKALKDLGISGDLPPGFIPDDPDASSPKNKPALEAGPSRNEAGIKEPDNSDLFSEDELRDLLPDFAKGQSENGGSLEDLKAGSPGGQPKFETQLGDSILPENSVRNEIDIQNGDPGRDLEENFARVLVPNGTITGSTEKKQFHIEGGLKIYYNEVLIEADKADIDERHDVAKLYGHVSIVDPEYTLLAGELLINFSEKRFQANGFVQFTKNAKADASQPDMTKDKKARLRDYFAKQQFELYCGTLNYNWESKELIASNSVRLVQPSFNGTLNRLDYNDKTKVYEMEGNVVLEISSYEWMFTNKLTEPEDEKKVRAITDGNTKISADRVRYSEESGVAEFWGISGNDVKFEQPKRSVVASYMEVNDKTKDFYAEGSATKKATYSQTDGQWLIAAGLVNKDAVSKEVNDALAGSLTADAQSITYNFDRKRLELRDGVTITTADKSVSAGQIIQDETAKFFLMRDNVVLKPNGQDYIYAAQIYVDTENDVFTFVGLVDGKFTSAEIPDFSPKPPDDAGAGAGIGNSGSDQRQGPAAGIFQNITGTGPAPKGSSSVESEDEPAKPVKARKTLSKDDDDDQEDADANVAEKGD